MRPYAEIRSAARWVIWRLAPFKWRKKLEEPGAEWPSLDKLGNHGVGEAKCVSLDNLECSGCLLEGFSRCNRPMGSNAAYMRDSGFVHTKFWIFFFYCRKLSENRQWGRVTSPKAQKIRIRPSRHDSYRAAFAMPLLDSNTLNTNITHTLK